MDKLEEEFLCFECGSFFPLKEKGEAILDGKSYNVCKSCCYQEQKKQFYSGL